MSMSGLARQVTVPKRTALLDFPLSRPDGMYMSFFVVSAISRQASGISILISILHPQFLHGLSFEAALDAMDAAALKGRDSTVDMVAKLGRSSRLGERSRGVMDAGSASCYLILHTMADTIKELLA